jgi:hypothetical protein
MRVGQFLLHRPAHRVLVEQRNTILAEQHGEVVQRRVIRRPVRLGQPAQIPRRCIVPDLVLCLAPRHVARRLQQHGSDERTQVRWSSGCALELFASDRFDPLGHARPVDLVGKQHQPMRWLDADHRLHRPRKQLRLLALATTLPHWFSPVVARQPS